MKLYLTGEPCNQQRHCYVVESHETVFIVDCGYQRCYAGDETPHLRPEHIRAAHYLFISHSHENQSGALEYLLDNGFTGKVVMTTETARQLPYPVVDPLILEGLSMPCHEAALPGGLYVTWGRSGHCSGSVWLRIRDSERSIFFSGDYYGRARIHASDPIENLTADLAVLDCDYGASHGGNVREMQISTLIEEIGDTLAVGRPVILPVPKFGRGLGILATISEYLPDADIFADDFFITELMHLDASAMWVRSEAQDILRDIFVRHFPQEFVALGVYFLTDPQLDTREGRRLVQDLLACGGQVIMTGTIEPDSHANLLFRAGHAQLLRYGVHCTQEDMLGIASKNHFGRVIAYRSDYAPTQAVYEV